MEKKKIAIVGPAYPYRGGNALFVSHLYKALAEEFEVKLFNFKLLYPQLLFPGTTQYDKSDQHYDKVPSERMINSMNPLSWWKTGQEISRWEPDLIAFDWWQPYFGPCYNGICRSINKAFRSRIVFITENVISHEARWVDKFLTRMAVKHGQQFLTLSKKVEQDIQELAKGRPVFRSELPVYGWYEVPDDFDAAAEKKALGFEASDTVLLFFGYVRHYKGLDILMRAFAQLQAQRPDLKLLVAGEFYDKPETYEALLDELGIAGKTKIINKYISNEEVARFFELAEAVVLPYRNGTQSGILNIAYGYQKPVVITDVGGLAEFVEPERTGVIVDKAEPEAVAQGIERYFELKETVDFAENIKARVAANSFGKIVSVFHQLLKGVKG